MPRSSRTPGSSRRKLGTKRKGSVQPLSLRPSVQRRQLLGLTNEMRAVGETDGPAAQLCREMSECRAAATNAACGH
jgi:hypothetical protein